MKIEESKSDTNLYLKFFLSFLPFCDTKCNIFKLSKTNKSRLFFGLMCENTNDSIFRAHLLELVNTKYHMLCYI